MKRPFRLVCVVMAAYVLLGLSYLIGTSCSLLRSGDMVEGWRGFPVPFYTCGSWGSYVSVVGVVIDYIFWLAVLLLVTRVRKEKAQKSAFMVVCSMLLLAAVLPYYFLLTMWPLDVAYLPYMLFFMIPTTLFLAVYASMSPYSFKIFFLILLFYILHIGVALTIFL